MTDRHDPAGAETLEIMRHAPRYNAWQYSRIAPYLGRRICEIGAGIGNMSTLMFRASRELMVLTDPDPHYLTVLGAEFAARNRVVVEPLTLPDPHAGERFEQFALDTVVALNVLEHIEDDVSALQSIATLLRPGGRVVVLVPALRALYGSLDRELGHYRRYSPQALAELMRQGGFQAHRLFYFNAVGALGWWANAKLLRQRRIARSQLELFDALVPLLRVEDQFRLPFGQSLIAVAATA